MGLSLVVGGAVTVVGVGLTGLVDTNCDGTDDVIKVGVVKAIDCEWVGDMVMEGGKDELSR